MWGDGWKIKAEDTRQTLLILAKKTHDYNYTCTVNIWFNKYRIYAHGFYNVRLTGNLKHPLMVITKSIKNPLSTS